MKAPLFGYSAMGRIPMLGGGRCPLHRPLIDAAADALEYGTRAL